MSASARPGHQPPAGGTAAAAAAPVAAGQAGTPPGARLVVEAPLAHLRWDGPRTPDTVAKPPLLLLHGIGGGRGAWAAVAPVLAASGHTVVAVDLPGYGLSAPAEPCTLGAMAEAVAQLVQHLGLGAAVLVGHSMGGMVAQELAAVHPALVAGLVLASTSPAFGKPGGDWQQGFLQSRYAPLDAGLGMAGLAAQLVPAMVGPQASAEAIAAAQALMATVPEPTYRAALAALVLFDRRAALAQITVPTLVITGQHDRSAAPEVSQRMAAAINGARCVIVPGAGHLLPMEAPQAFAQALLASGLV